MHLTARIGAGSVGVEIDLIALYGRTGRPIASKRYSTLIEQPDPEVVATPPEREFSSLNTIKIAEIILLQYTISYVDINPWKGRISRPMGKGFR